MDFWKSNQYTVYWEAFGNPIYSQWIGERDNTYTSQTSICFMGTFLPVHYPCDKDLESYSCWQETSATYLLGLSRVQKKPYHCSSWNWNLSWWLNNNYSGLFLWSNINDMHSSLFLGSFSFLWPFSSSHPHPRLFTTLQSFVYTCQTSRLSGKGSLDMQECCSLGCTGISSYVGDWVNLNI